MLKTLATPLRRLVGGATFAAALGLACAPAIAQQPLRWIVPYSAGGGSDVMARTIAAAISEGSGRTIVVDNRPGAGTIIGMNALLSSPADGNTVASADIGTLAFNPSLYRQLPYNPETSFRHVGGLVRNAFVLAVKPGLPVSSLQEFLELARSQPGKLTYASAGVGSPHHVGMEMLQQRAGLQLTHVPYKGGAPAVQDLMSGQVDAMLLDLPGGLPYISSDRIKVLGVATPTRQSMIPQVPTLDEQGLPDVIAYSWQALVAPAGTPADATAQLTDDLRRALESPAVRSKLNAIGAEAMPLGAEEAAALIAAEGARWREVIKTANISLD